MSFWSRVLICVSVFGTHDEAITLVFEILESFDSRTRTATSTRFSHRTTVSTRKPASFWREKRETVVILLQGFTNVVVSKRVNNTVAVLAFFDQQKGPGNSNKNN